MNIVALVKHVVDSTEVRFDKKTGELRLRGLPEKISDYDKNAIEEAVRIKTKIGGKVTAISFGTKNSAKSLKEAVAMGADEGVLAFYNKADQIYDPIFIAKVLAKTIEHLGGSELVLCGAMTEDMTNKIIGSGVASFLNYQHLSNVDRLSIDGPDKIVTVSEIDGNEIEVESKLPVVLSVSRKLNEPRMATKIQIMKVPMRKVSTVSLKDIGLSDDPSTEIGCDFISFTPITKDRKQIIFNQDPAIAVDNLIEKLTKEGVL